MAPLTLVVLGIMYGLEFDRESVQTFEHVWMRGITYPFKMVMVQPNTKKPGDREQALRAIDQLGGALCKLGYRVNFTDPNNRSGIWVPLVPSHKPSKVF